MLSRYIVAPGNGGVSSCGHGGGTRESNEVGIEGERSLRKGDVGIAHVRCRQVDLCGAIQSCLNCTSRVERYPNRGAQEE